MRRRTGGANIAAMAAVASPPNSSARSRDRMLWNTRTNSSPPTTLKIPARLKVSSRAVAITAASNTRRQPWKRIMQTHRPVTMQIPATFGSTHVPPSRIDREAPSSVNANRVAVYCAAYPMTLKYRNDVWFGSNATIYMPKMAFIATPYTKMRPKRAKLSCDNCNSASNANVGSSHLMKVEIARILAPVATTEIADVTIKRDYGPFERVYRSREPRMNEGGDHDAEHQRQVEGKADAGKTSEWQGRQHESQAPIQPERMSQSDIDGQDQPDERNDSQHGQLAEGHCQPHHGRNHSNDQEGYHMIAELIPAGVHEDYVLSSTS